MTESEKEDDRMETKLIFKRCVTLVILVMLILGVIGEYIGRIYLSLNQNPQYVVKEVIKSEKSE